MTPAGQSDPVITQETTPVIPEQEVKQPSKQKKYRKIILICIIILLVIPVLGFILALITQPKNSTNPLDNPAIMKMAEKLPIPKITMVAITPAPTAMSLITDDFAPSPMPLPPKWETYHNSDLNFSLKYPYGLTSKENSHGLGVSEISITTSGNTDPDNMPDYQILIYPKTIGKLIGQDFDQLYTIPDGSTQRLTSQGNPSNLYTKIKNTTVNNLRALVYISTSDPVDPGEQAEYGYYIEIGNSTLIITTGEDNKAILDYMISTFK